MSDPLTRILEMEAIFLKMVLAFLNGDKLEQAKSVLEIQLKHLEKTIKISKSLESSFEEDMTDAVEKAFASVSRGDVQ